MFPQVLPSPDFPKPSSIQAFAAPALPVGERPRAGRGKLRPRRVRAHADPGKLTPRGGFFKYAAVCLRRKPRDGALSTRRRRS